ncbi:hypothetical protein B5K03_13400 [Rhizobium phaseoli]|nr:hypothetical protein B5K03_13400 [Rhizobium phaseoli]
MNGKRCSTSPIDLAADGSVKGAGTIRTARKLFDGLLFPNLPVSSSEQTIRRNASSRASSAAR